MRRRLGWLGCLLLLTSAAWAQFTTVSGTVTDPNGLPYAFGTISAQLVSSGSPKFTSTNQPYTPPNQPTGLSSAGSFTVQLADNTQLTPGGSTWTFTVSCGVGCVPVAGGKGPVSFTVSGITISGASQSITATLTAAALPLTTVIGAAAFPVTSPQTVNTGGAITPSGAGEIVSTGLWWNPGGLGLFAPQPTLTGSLTGGNFTSGANTFIQIQLLNAFGHSNPSVEELFTFNAGNNCGSGTVCSVTVTAPTLLTGQTYSVFAGGSGAEAAVLACQGITTNCVVQAAGTGGAPPSGNTSAPVNPPNLQPSTGPANQSASLFIQDALGVNYHTAADINLQTVFSGFATRGFPEFVYPTIFNASGVQPSSTGNGAPMTANGSMLIFWQPSPTTTTVGSQCQLNTPTTDSNNYGGQAICMYLESDFSGTGNLTGASTPGQVSGGGVRGVNAWRTASGSGQLGLLAGVSGSTFREAGSINGCGNNTCYVGGYFTTFNYATTDNTEGSKYVGVLAQVNDGGNNDATGQGYAYYAQTPANKFTRTDIPANVGYYSENYGTGGGNWDLFLSGLVGTPDNGKAFLGGNVYLPNLFAAASTIGVTGSLAAAGSISTGQFATPGAPGIGLIGGSGATTWAYKLVGVDGNNDTTAVSPATTTNSGSATLNGTTYNNVCLNSYSALGFGGTSAWRVYRTQATGTPNTTGLIGTITLANPFVAGVSQCLADQGLAADGGTAPTANTTGAVIAPAGSISHLTGNLAYLDQNFTTAANTSLQTITGSTHSLVLNLPPTAIVYSFHCSLSYSQGTANAAVAFGIQSATVAPTNIFANGTEQTNTTAYSGGTLATLTTTTATNIVSATPGATATNFTAILDGTIEEPANDQGNVINFMVSTATAGDAVTVLRGSYCQLF